MPGITAMKLQKLVYYCQAWSLVWDERPIFNEKIEAWANGPVVRELFQAHRGAYNVYKINGDVRVLGKAQEETIDAVIRAYGDKSSEWLAELTHREAPWKDARTGLMPGERGDKEITHDAMAWYYSSLKP